MKNYDQAIRSLMVGSAGVIVILALAGWEPLFGGRAVGAEQLKKAPGSFTISACDFDRGLNVVTLTSGSYADAEPLVGNRVMPTEIEYDIDFPVAAEYAICLRYSAATARPVGLFLDGESLGTCCRTPTGGWNTSQANWEETCRVRITQGSHTVRLYSAGVYPHVVALRFDSPVPFPKDWRLQRKAARKLKAPATEVKTDAIRLAIVDLMESFGPRYPDGRGYLERLGALEGKRDALPENAREELEKVAESLTALRREALLANPLLDFDRLLLIKRGAKNLGLPRNWESNSSLSAAGFDDQIVVLSPVGPGGELTTLFKPDRDVFVGDVDLHFNADKMLFSMLAENGRWQVFEMAADGSGLRQLTGEQPDVDSYDACYLPDGRILFTSTACFVGVPCVTGASHVAVIYAMDTDGKNIRQLCFDQEHSWCPAVLNNGRVLYTRWEYTDTPHSNSRLLFHMNPDGTEQMEYYGSNSYWPNSIFYARPIPGHATKVVGIVGGHHDNPRMGELVIFDPARGRFEADGVVQRIPGRGQKVEPIIADGLTLNSWPKFLHPYPLSEKYFLVSCKPTPQSLWGIYLVDTFDNMVLIAEQADYALFEPVPLRENPAPPPVPAKVNLARNDAEVYISDIYAGDGLKGIPRGTVKSLRLFTYNFAFHNLSGSMGVVGMDGPWDIKRVIGTVPVCGDGSARFEIPANTPIALQPLDAEGKALQLMRSWMTAIARRGCLVCRDATRKQNTAPPVQTDPGPGNRAPAEIEPWYGPTRGFAYAREVQTGSRSPLHLLPRRPSASGRDPRVADLRENRDDLRLQDSWQRRRWAAGSRSAIPELHRYRATAGPGERLPPLGADGVFTPTLRNWCSCFARGTTTSSWTRRVGTA